MQRDYDSETENKASRLERRSKSFWVMLILGFFGMDLTIAAIAISMAAADPSFRSIPGYGERAVAWDERQQLKAAWSNKNWKIEIMRPNAQHDGIRLSIRNQQDEPVSGYTGHVSLFHYTRVATQVRGSLHELSPGCYEAEVDVRKPGLWNLEVELTSPDNEHLWYEQSLELDASATVDSLADRAPKR
jgi:nitrogen fixation protein FixH